jgi:hypothetical protein
MFHQKFGLMQLSTFATLSAKTGPSASQQGVLLFDHLIGRSKQRRWDLKTERLGSFEINGKLEFGWLLYRQITWLGALQMSTVVAPRRNASGQFAP